MKSVLIICNSNPSFDPRPNRIIHCLRDDCRVTVAGTGEFYFGPDDVRFSDPLSDNLFRKLRNAAYLKMRFFEKVVWNARMKRLRNELLNRDFELVITHDLSLLPFAFTVKKKAPLLFDAREYYPGHFEDKFIWRFFFREFNNYLCRKYLQKCDAMITVSEGIADKYRMNYGITTEVYMSLPTYCNLAPSPVAPTIIKVIHHGHANSSRRIETMIEMMDYVDARFTLDLMLVPVDHRYYRKLASMAAQRGNVKLVPAVAFDKIISFSNQYDIGLFLVSPTTINLKYTLPNKLFEFIQARLAVAIGPSIDMKKIVDKYDCGIVSKDFDPRSLAEELNKLTAEKVKYFKAQSHKAAAELCADKNCIRIKEIVENLLR